jgi:hypothetical protein
MRDSLVEFTLSLASEVRKQEAVAINRQRAATLNKQEMLRKKRLIAAQRENANALTFLDMYYSPAC